MNDARDDEMYQINNLLDRLRTEFYELLSFDQDTVASSAREIRRREVLYLVAELRLKAERS